jgi:hypothetical protein
MWEIEVSAEVEAYFMENGALVFSLLRKLAELMIAPDGLPQEPTTKTKQGLIRWETLEHIVFYARREQENRLIITVIKPK